MGLWRAMAHHRPVAMNSKTNTVAPTAVRKGRAFMGRQRMT